MGQRGQLERKLWNRPPRHVRVVAELARQCEHGQDRHRERVVFSVAAQDRETKRFRRRAARGAPQPRPGSVHGRGDSLVIPGRLRERGPDDRCRADVAAAADGVAPPAVGVLMPNQPRGSSLHESGQPIARREAVARRRVEGEHRGRRRERAARQMSFPVVRGRPAIEQPAAEEAQRRIKSIAVERRHDGSRLRWPRASSA